MRLACIRALLNALAAAAWLACVASAAVIGLDETAMNGAHIFVPVLMQDVGDGEVAGVQFDLDYDRDVLTLVEVQTGPAAADAGKSAACGCPSSGRARVLITGMNQQTMTDGELATLVFSVDNPGDASPFALRDLRAADPFGNPVALAFPDSSEAPTEAEAKSRPIGEESLGSAGVAASLGDGEAAADTGREGGNSGFWPGGASEKALQDAHRNSSFLQQLDAGVSGRAKRQRQMSRDRAQTSVARRQHTDGLSGPPNRSENRRNAWTPSEPVEAYAGPTLVLAAATTPGAALGASWRGGGPAGGEPGPSGPASSRVAGRGGKQAMIALVCAILFVFLLLIRSIVLRIPGKTS